MTDLHVFEREIDGSRHRVEIDPGVWGRTVRWFADGDEVASKHSGSNTVTVEGEQAGSIVAKISTYGRPRRVTWYPASATPSAPDDEEPSAKTTDSAEHDEPVEDDEVNAEEEEEDDQDADRAKLDKLLGVGGHDLIPEEGSPAAQRDELMRTRPRLYTAIQTGSAVVGILLPILLTYVAIRLLALIPWPSVDLPSIPFPDLPSIPWPSIPWPDLPSIPWPDWSLPGWLDPVIENLRYIWVILLAYFIARGEVRRRRAQDEKRAADEPDRSRTKSVSDEADKTDEAAKDHSQSSDSQRD